jgi:single-strand DNA-binding protein
MNKFIGLGNLTRDPVLKEIKSGTKVCEFSIAINNKANNSVFYIDVEAWNNVAENCGRFLSKGRKVLVEGRLSSSNWTTKTGENRIKVYCKADLVTFLDKTEEQTQNSVAEKTADKILNEDEFADIPF